MVAARAAEDAAGGREILAAVGYPAAPTEVRVRAGREARFSA